MDHTEDVERLFSWLKAPMVHYREFAPQHEVAEAVATWPVAHRAAVEAGMAAASENAPHGDAAAKARNARERISLPPAVQAVPATPLPEELPSASAVETPPGGPTAGRASDRPAAPIELAESAAPPAPPTDQRDAGEPPRETAEPSIAGFDPPSPSVRQASTVRAEPDDLGRGEPARQYPARDRDALFGGEYRGRERDARPSSRVADRQDRSLDAVFSRLSGGRDRLPDPRSRARTSPGLGSVFGRLR
jgi:hypothetical protein